LAKIVHIIEKNAGFYHMGHAHACGFEDGSDVLKDQISLSFKAFSHVSGAGVDAQLSADKKGVVH
jgi:hypothetical protein